MKVTVLLRRVADIPVHVVFGSRTVLGDIVDNIHCEPISRHSHLSSWLPGFLCLVEGEDGVES